MIEFKLRHKFADQFEILKSLFPADHFTSERIERLDQIFTVTEEKWQENLRRLSGCTVKYLLIGEAAPWTASGTVRYFYTTCDGPWVSRVWRAFFDYIKPTSPEEALVQFASRGFLLVDSLPFAEEYSGRRRRKSYRQLVENCSAFLLEKINDYHIDWADHVRAALAFKLNGRAVIESFPDGIPLPIGQSVHMSDDLICSDGSGYTSPSSLRSVFGIENKTKRRQKDEQICLRTGSVHRWMSKPLSHNRFDREG